MSTGHRWLMGLAGLAWLVLGVMFFTRPVAAFVAGGVMAFFIAFTLILSGLFEIIAWVMEPKGAKRFWTLAGGIILVALGIMLFNNPLVVIISIPYILAFTLIFRGVIEMVGAFSAKALGFQAWGLILFSGLLAFALGMMMLVTPFQTAIIYFGISFIFYGIAEIAAAFAAKEPEHLA